MARCKHCNKVLIATESRILEKCWRCSQDQDRLLGQAFELMERQQEEEQYRQAVFEGKLRALVQVLSELPDDDPEQAVQFVQAVRPQFTDEEWEAVQQMFARLEAEPE